MKNQYLAILLLAAACSAQPMVSESDETATSILKQYLALERDHVAILTAYLPRFQKVLPPKKVAKLYQIENKSRALVNYELARGIPLAK